MGCMWGFEMGARVSEYTHYDTVVALRMAWLVCLWRLEHTEQPWLWIDDVTFSRNRRRERERDDSREQAGEFERGRIRRGFEAHFGVPSSGHQLQVKGYGEIHAFG